MNLIREIIFVTSAIAFISAASSKSSQGSETNAGTCGVPKGITFLIVNGKNFTRGDFPWTVALMDVRTQPPSYFCGATLISSNFALTAAHCILEKQSAKPMLPRDIFALFGAHNLSNPYEPERITLSPKNIIVHEDWNPHITEYDADIAILEFQEGRMHFGADSFFIQPICLWGSEIPPSEKEGTVTGWGQSEDPTKLHEIEPKLIKVPIHTNEECFFSAKEILALSSNRTFCAGSQNGTGVCRGDSGSGLFIKVNGISYLKGIVSSSLLKEAGCDVFKSAVYTNVLQFRDWIEKHTGKVIQPHVTSTQCLENPIDPRLIDDTRNAYRSVNKKGLKDLPILGKMFPELKNVVVTSCGITVLRYCYFIELKKVTNVNLNSNKITTVEANAFADLVSVNTLNLSNNKIETLEENLFATMIMLVHLHLQNNQIKILSPTTLIIIGGKLKKIHLQNNVCITGTYTLPQNQKNLETALTSRCK